MTTVFGTLAVVSLVMAWAQWRYTATRRSGEALVYLGLSVVFVVTAWAWR